VTLERINPSEQVRDDRTPAFSSWCTEPTMALLRRPDAALDADVRHDFGSVWFESTQPDLIRMAVSGQKRLPSHTATHHAVEALK
jgi:hypothetical protein